jgi:hypothetical protein
VAARAEVPRLAGKGEDAGVPALVAVDPGEAMLRIAALEEPPDDVVLDAAPETAVRLQVSTETTSGILLQRKRIRRICEQNSQIPAAHVKACY